MAEYEAQPTEVSEYTPSDTPGALRISETLRRIVDWFGRFGSWFLLPLIIITTMDIVMRKIQGGRFQLWMVENFGRFFNSTVLQELEWHMHTVVFALVLGYGYIWNTHVRVDLVRERLHLRKKAWLEFIGLSLFMLPFICVTIYFATVFAIDSYNVGEISASTVGLTHRWIIKTVLVVGLIVAAVAGISVWLQVFMVLFGEQNKRFPLMTLEWPEDEGSKIEGKERLDLSKAEDVLIERARRAGHLSSD